MKKLVVFPVLLSILASCSSTTNIRSTDPNAKIYVDGEFKGTGVATHTDSKTIVSAPTQVRIQKEGCQCRDFMGGFLSDLCWRDYQCH